MVLGDPLRAGQMGRREPTTWREPEPQGARAAQEEARKRGRHPSTSALSKDLVSLGK